MFLTMFACFLPARGGESHAVEDAFGDMIQDVPYAYRAMRVTKNPK